MTFLRRILRTFHRGSHWKDLEEELQFHVSMREQRNLNEGMIPEEARRQARLKFGNPAVWMERVSEVDLMLLLRSISQDFHFGVRQLWRNPWFAITAVLTLALGIGLNTAIFSVVYAVLMKPLPWPGADRMVAIYEHVPKFGTMNDSWPDFLDWQSQNHVFSKMAALQPTEFHLNMAGQDQPVPGASVTNAFFELFGANVILGRTFASDESVPGSSPAAVVSYAFWQHFLDGDRNALGRTIVLDGQPATLVGVLSPEFRVPYGPYEAFLPLGVKANTSQLKSRANHPGLKVVAELMPAVSAAAARIEMATIMDQLGQAYPDSDKSESAVIMPLMDQFVGQARSILLMLIGASGLILVLACANLANICLARAASRQREYSVRASLGAGRWRMFRQALVENMPLALIGGATGIGLAALLIKPIVHLYPHQLFRLKESGLNVMVICFATGISVASWLAFGLIPALVVSGRKELYPSMRMLSSGNRRRFARPRVRSTLLALEIAVALVVTISTGLLLRSLEAVTHVDPGFRPDHLLVLEGIHAMKGSASLENAVFYRELLERLRQLPGVRDASAAMELPLRGAFWTSPYVPDGHAEAPDTQQPWTKINFAMPGYFQTVGMHLLNGRFLNTGDDRAFVVVINETMARSLGRNDVIGRQIYVQYAPHPMMQIVGVVADEKQFGLEQKNMPEVFIPAAQSPMAAMDVVLRTTSDPESMANPAVAVVHDFAKDQSPPRALTMEDLLGSGLGDRKFASLLFSLFDCLAVTLAIIGVAGVVSYTVQQRTREIGVRMALGAKKRDVVTMIVFGEGAMPALVGVVLGIAGAAGIAHVLTNQLYGVTSSDPVTFAAASALMLGATLLASFIPARRAAGVDPSVTLRCE